ncbi:DUF3040 domain-containing protein [Rhodococcus aerolatus]
MPLSEHEQRLLDQIESALYAEDPKFASNVRGARMRSATRRRRVQAAAIFILGLVLLIVGIALPLRPGGFPVVSVLGFLVMFGGGVLAVLGRGGPAAPGSDGGGGGKGGPGRGEPKPGGLSSRMEERFKKRFDQE